MQIKNTINTYGSVAKFFHWLIFLLLLGMIIYGYFLDSFPKEYGSIVYNTHKLTGLLILCLMILRGLWALINIKPALPFNTPNWQRHAERLMHYLLYAVVIAMPIAGLIGSSSAGKPPHLGDLSLALPIEKNKQLIDWSFSTHNMLAIVIIVLVSLHILAALYHYFIKRDDILPRMWIGKKRY